MTSSLSRFGRPAVVIAVVLLLILWASGALHRKVHPGRVAAEPGAPIPAGAERLRVAATPFAPRLGVVGTTASKQMVHLSARVSAYVKEVRATAGQAVKQGDVLVVLDDRDIQEQVAAAEAQRRQAESEYQRAQQLFAKQATTDQALTAAATAFQMASAGVERARVMLTDTILKAPMDAVVTDRRVEPGDLANPGQVLLSVYDPAGMRLEAPVPVRLITKLTPGQAFDVEIDRESLSLTGHVAQIVSEVDPISRTQLVKVDLDGNVTGILPGSFGRLWVPDDERLAIRVPATAVYRMGQLELVRIVEGTRAISRVVRIGERDGDRVEILSGLDAGDEILAHPDQIAMEP